MLTDQNHNFYIFKESYIRLSSEKFDLNLNENFSNKYIHLTNNAVQKNGKDYGLYEDGNILSFNALNEITDDIKVSTNYVFLSNFIIKKADDENEELHPNDNADNGCQARPSPKKILL